LGFLGLLKIKIALEAFEIWTLLSNVVANLINFIKILLHKSSKINFWLAENFEANLALPNFQTRQARAWGHIWYKILSMSPMPDLPLLITTYLCM
jgi:hypothetical protein